MIIHKDERYEFINNEVGRKFRDDFIKKLKSQNIIVNEYEDKLKIVINVTYTNITVSDESIMELDQVSRRKRIIEFLLEVDMRYIKFFCFGSIIVERIEE